MPARSVRTGSDVPTISASVASSGVSRRTLWARSRAYRAALSTIAESSVGRNGFVR